MDQSSKVWKRGPDQVKSAKTLIDEASWVSPERKATFMVEPVPLHNEDGFTALAFALPKVLRQWSGRIREVSLDSACKFLFRFIDISLMSPLSREYQWLQL